VGSRKCARGRERFVARDEPNGICRSVAGSGEGGGDRERDG
jgi:hypothetical protein